MVTEHKLKLAEQVRDEYQRMTEDLKTVLEDKENELRLAKEKVVQEYHDSDALLTELRTSYNDGFDDALRQAKALYPKFDFSAININIAEGMSVQPDASNDTAELFAEERPVTVVPELHTEEGKTHEAKTPSSPMFSHLLLLYFFFKHFENTLDFSRCMSGRFVSVVFDI